MKELSGAILTASKADLAICNVFGNLPSGLIPVNGKPILFYILNQFYDKGIKDIYIGVDYRKEKLINVVDNYFSKKLNLKYIHTKKEKGVGNSLLKLLQNIKNGPVCVNLADTFIKNYDIKLDDIIVSDTFDYSRRWSYIKVDDNLKIDKFINKKKVSYGKNNLYTIAGVYTFSEAEVFGEFNEFSDELEITDLLEFYVSKNNRLTFQLSNEWMDFGHIDNYYSSKKRLIQSREFNELTYEDFLGTITKKSRNTEKLKKEIKWYKNLPKNLKVISPRIIKSSIGNDTYIQSEYYSYPPLSEIWLFSEVNEHVMQSMINKLFKILRLFQSYSKKVSIGDYESIYIDKTKQRLAAIKNNDIKSLLLAESIVINGEKYQSWNFIKDKIFHKIKDLYNIDHNCLIHGDFCLSNILYDLQSGLFKLIDPRGSFGQNENGDIKYDIAKLRHSICGDYDYIMADLFVIEKKSKNELQFTIFDKNRKNIKNYFDYILSKEFDLKQIKLIEGLLFLSMIPLHSDNAKRQLIMLARGIKLLNQVL